jgi:hypothetical protein
LFIFWSEARASSNSPKEEELQHETQAYLEWLIFGEQGQVLLFG